VNSIIFLFEQITAGVIGQPLRENHEKKITIHLFIQMLDSFIECHQQTYNTVKGSIVV